MFRWMSKEIEAIDARALRQFAVGASLGQADPNHHTTKAQWRRIEHTAFPIVYDADGPTTPEGE